MKRVITIGALAAVVLSIALMPWGAQAAKQAEKHGGVMRGYVKDIEDLAVKNNDFRRVLYTAKHSQLVVMSLKPGEEIGMEVHKLDQFLRVEQGSGEAVLDGVSTKIRAGFAIIVPAGTKHNIINTGMGPSTIPAQMRWPTRTITLTAKLLNQRGKIA